MACYYWRYQCHLRAVWCKNSPLRRSLRRFRSCRKLMADEADILQAILGYLLPTTNYCLSAARFFHLLRSHMWEATIWDSESAFVARNTMENWGFSESSAKIDQGSSVKEAWLREWYTSAALQHAAGWLNAELQVPRSKTEWYCRIFFWKKNRSFINWFNILLLLFNVHRFRFIYSLSMFSYSLSMSMWAIPFAMVQSGLQQLQSLRVHPCCSTSNAGGRLLYPKSTIPSGKLT